MFALAYFFNATKRSRYEKVYKSIQIIREESEAVDKDTDGIMLTFKTHFGVTILFFFHPGRQLHRSDFTVKSCQLQIKGIFDLS